jgi:hypothetical protein
MHRFEIGCKLRLEYPAAMLLGGLKIARVVLGRKRAFTFSMIRRIYSGHGISAVVLIQPSRVLQSGPRSF